MQRLDWLFDLLIDVSFDKRLSDKTKKLNRFGLLVTGDDRTHFRTVSLDNKKHILRVYIVLSLFLWTTKRIDSRQLPRCTKKIHIGRFVGRRREAIVGDTMSSFTRFTRACLIMDWPSPSGAQ